MSKIPKPTEKEPKSKKKYRSDENYAFRSVIISASLGGLFYLISLLFNLEIITIFMNQGLLLNIIDILIKVLIILLFFIFAITSLGNYKELIGKPVDWKELLLLFLLSIGQTLMNSVVFVFTFFGLVGILLYFYIIQEI